jgi:hypothetical protein
MPGRIQAFRELPGDIQKLTALTVVTFLIAITALVIASTKHGS